MLTKFPGMREIEENTERVIPIVRLSKEGLKAPRIVAFLSNV